MKLAILLSSLLSLSATITPNDFGYQNQTPEILSESDKSNFSELDDLSSESVELGEQIFKTIKYEDFMKLDLSEMSEDELKYIMVAITPEHTGNIQWDNELRNMISIIQV